MSSGQHRSRSRRTSSGAANAEARTIPAVRRPRFWIVAAIVLALVAAYSSALRAPFELDDTGSITTNPTIRTLAPSVALDPPGGDEAVSGRPVANYSLALNYALNDAFGVDQNPDPAGPNKTVGYHLVNVLVHLLCGALLFGVARRTLRSIRPDERSPRHADALAGIIACIWLFHPLQSEVVDYVVQRTESIAALCYLATLYASIRAWDAAGRGASVRWYIASVVACVVGMATKEIVITAPLVVVLYDVAFRPTSWTTLRSTGRVWLYLALVATCALSVGLIAGGSRGKTVGFHLGIAWYEYLYSQAWAIGRYVRLFFWPSALTFDYGAAPVRGPAGVPGFLMLTAAGVATIVAWTRARWRWLGFLGAWFFLILAPSSSFVPITTEIAAERRIYLSIISVIVLVVLAADALRHRLVARLTDEQRRRFDRPVTAVAMGLVALLLLGTTFVRGRTYADAERLWIDTIHKAPRNPRAYDNLAAAMLARRPTEYAAADSLYRRAISVDSSYIPAWSNLAEIDIEQGRLAAADTVLRRALAIDSNSVDVVAKLGGVLMRQGDATHAIPYLERVASQFPTGENLVNLAGAYLRVERPGDAVAALQRAVAVEPTRGDALNLLGALLVEGGRPDEAVPYLESAVRQSPGAAGQPLAVLSLAYAELGRAADALQAAGRATFGSADPSVYLFAGRAALLAERPLDAERYFARAVELAPADPEALTRLGIAMASLGKPADSAELFRRALAVEPDYAPAQRALAALRGKPGS